MQNMKLAKIAIFSQVRGHRNLQFFWFSGKPLKIKESIPTWHQDNWNVKIHSFGGKICRTLKLAKIAIFSQVRGHRNLQFFWFSGKPLKIKESIPTWHQDNWNVKIHSFGGKICRTLKLAKLQFFRRSAVIEIFNFFDFLESLWKSRKASYLTSGQLKCKNSLIWGQNMQNTEISKIAIFSQVRGHRIFNFFDFWKAFENKESIPTWHQDNWNVKIHSFGGKICQNTEISKIAIFSQVRGHRNLQFFDFLESLWKSRKASLLDIRTTEM